MTNKYKYTYERMMSQRTYFPDEISRDTIDDIANTLTYIVERNRRNEHHKIVVDVMTDQIDVYLNNKKIATYMIM